jgi:cytochrome P450
MIDQVTLETPTRRRAPTPGEEPVREIAPLAPGDRGIPWLGRIFDYSSDPMALFRHQWQTYGPVSPFNYVGETGAIILGPDACDEVLRNRSKAFANGPAWGKIVGPFFKRGLMLLDFEEHHMHRRIMQEAFTRDRLSAYVARMHPAIEQGMADWVTDAGFKAYPAMKKLTLDVAADIFMGGAQDTSSAGMDRINKAFITCVQAAAGVVRAEVPGTRWGRAFRARRVLEGFLRHYLPTKRATRTDDLFSVLCHIEDEHGQRFSDDDVVNHMIFLMMAAHDTTTTTTSTMLQYLGQHPEWQERCREESLALGPEPTLDEIESLEAADWVMREALRLRAPVPTLVRRAVKDVVVQGCRIPAGTDVMVGVQFSHLMEEYWTNPAVFDPARFSPERREDKSHRLAWEPFGGGVHKCIGLYFGGMEVKAILHRLLRSYRWSVDPGYVAPLDNHSLPFPEDGQPINLIRTGGAR